MAEGVNPTHPTSDGLAPYDHFHGRGLQATEELANSLSVSVNHHVLDIGSGIGGPARYFATRFGCRVTGIDLTYEFCDVARVLTTGLELDGRVAFAQGNAVTMPFAAATFDGAYSMNVSMNIADKSGLYREIYRVLKPSASLVLSEIAQGPTGQPYYPTPWAKTAEISFLATPRETRHELEASGFNIVNIRETRREALAFGALSRAMVERGEKPPHRAVQLIHGDVATEMAANTARGLAEATLIPIEVVCKKRDKEHS